MEKVRVGVGHDYGHVDVRVELPSAERGRDAGVAAPDGDQVHVGSSAHGLNEWDGLQAWTDGVSVGPTALRLSLPSGEACGMTTSAASAGVMRGYRALMAPTATTPPTT